MSADDDDIRDAMLFRFWCRAASPGSGMLMDAAKTLLHCITPDDYRKALTELAKKHGINLPE